MRAKDIIINDYYRHKSSPYKYYAKAVVILNQKEGVNSNNFIVVMCEWTNSKNSAIGCIKYFKPKDLIKIKE